ncbi:hypothetical protein SSX86_017885 [Deinandra increscens subsp. villosa]|uniref:GIR1-like zinc ribbon domain-containing protein n=1 Tax=Deinandra increscens subsp. villosa TaxID=3103831 RepID=A0AAP0D3E2_9ASTR
MVSMKGIKRENDEVSFKSLFVHGSSSNLKVEAADKQGDHYSSPSQQDSSHGPMTIEHEVDDGIELILLGCMRCYMYVMVREENLKCPRCRKADCLRDLFLEKPVKENKIMKRE